MTASPGHLSLSAQVGSLSSAAGSDGAQQVLAGTPGAGASGSPPDLRDCGAFIPGPAGPGATRPPPLNRKPKGGVDPALTASQCATSLLRFTETWALNQWLNMLQQGLESTLRARPVAPSLARAPLRTWRRRHLWWPRRRPRLRSRARMAGPPW